MYITIDDLKRHLNIDHDLDDAYLVELEKVAEASIATYLQRDLSELCDNTLPCPHETLNPQVRHAIRILVGTWYKEREAVSAVEQKQVPFTLNALLTPLKKFE